MGKWGGWVSPTLQAIVEGDFFHDFFVWLGVEGVCPVRME